MRTPEEWFEIERKASEHLELIGEVARLKAEVAFNAGAGAAARRIEELERENADLMQSYQEVGKNWDEAGKRAEAAEAEVERLREDLDGTLGFIGFRASAKVWQQRTEAAEAEVARLLAQLSKADRQIRQLGADSLSSLRERDEARAEVERLREIAKAYSSMTWEHDMIAAEVCPRVGESLLAAVKRVVYAALRGEGEK